MMLILVMLRGLEMNVQRYAFLSMWRKKTLRRAAVSAGGYILNIRPDLPFSAVGGIFFFNSGGEEKALRFHIVDVSGRRQGNFFLPCRPIVVYLHFLFAGRLMSAEGDR